MAALSLTLRVPASVIPTDAAVRMAGTEDAPLWCLADVCLVLGVRQSHAVARRLDDDQKVRNIVTTLGGPQEMWFVNEPGLYHIILTTNTKRDGSAEATARNEQVKKFQRWVFHEVLPSIRKHKCYPPPVTVAEPCPTLSAWSRRLNPLVLEFRADLEAYSTEVWAVVTETVTDILIAEDEMVRNGVILSLKDLPEGSVGQRWANFRRKQSWAGQAIREVPMRLETFTHDGRPRYEKPWLYPNCERPMFRRWFREEYVPEHFGDYLYQKFRVRHQEKTPADRLAASANGVSARIAKCPSRLPMPLIKAVAQDRQLNLFGELIGGE